jgi:uncharacterized protein YfaT (DUF1175 family)
VIESDSLLEFDRILSLVSQNNISLIVVTCKQLLEWLFSAHSPQQSNPFLIIIPEFGF